MESATFISLALYFIVVLGIGLFSFKQANSNVSGYMLEGRSLSPLLTALSAGASDMSGWILRVYRGRLFIWSVEC